MRSPMLWLFAVLITLSSAVYQRMTGPSYPARGKKAISTSLVRYQLPRTQGDGDAEVRVAVAEAEVKGQIAWKRYKTADKWTYVEMKREGTDLVGRLPHQPPAGKLMYRVVLHTAAERVSLGGEPVIIRFKGEVPMPVLVVHVVLMFSAMLFSTRTGLEVFEAKPAFGWMLAVTVLVLTVGGMVLGPIVQKYAFDAYWTGWPFGTDLTDNKTAVAWLAWLAAWLKYRRNPAGAGKWIVGAAVATLIIFGIPHSAFGSELKYE